MDTTGTGLAQLGPTLPFPSPPTSVALLLGCGSLADRYPTAFTRRRTILAGLRGRGSPFPRSTLSKITVDVSRSPLRLRDLDATSKAVFLSFPLTTHAVHTKVTASMSCHCPYSG